jgi:hypothetical protein
MYVPLAVFFAALALDRAAPAGWPRRTAAAALVALTVAWSAVVDDAPRSDWVYDAGPVQRAWQATREGSAIPEVTHIAMSTNSLGQPARTINRNDAMIYGGSQALCYQPMFGYWLESMPAGALRIGAALAEFGDGVLNVKNPACYVYSTANHCRPGDHFTVRQRTAAERFLRYEPFEFAMPAWQSAANMISLAALLLTAIVLALAAIAGLSRRAQR